MLERISFVVSARIALNPAVCYNTRVLPCPGGQVARALQYMHSKQIVHRDVKPENVMIIDRPTEDGLYPEVCMGIQQSSCSCSLYSEYLTSVCVRQGVPIFGCISPCVY